MDKVKNTAERNMIDENIIDETYNGADYPIVEREYNAYYFPENYNPDNMEAQSEAIDSCVKERCTVKVWKDAKTK
ncbi:hypothetical protein [Lutispora saccharofermentans]|uniref:Uncharacterized protein n=1 Tax=Lutispora saccharofermentans TaxID=3024236 RepID=A0ABT1NBV8_9FIRM|nr:hypothetical protein [Lutispora saccharofermentans]MCQ1528745.1 hypothetical protein [Lutispora saccharofermentans]